MEAKKATKAKAKAVDVAEAKEVAPVEAAKAATPAKKEKHVAGAFDDLIKLLKDANAKIAEADKVKIKLLNDDEKTAAEKQKEYMQYFNAAILSFNNLPAAATRCAKTQKQIIWREKEFAIKTFFKEEV